MKYPDFWIDESTAREMQEEVTETLGRLMDSIDSDFDDPEVPTPSGEHFDACEVCVIREIMWLTTIRVLEAHSAGLVELASARNEGIPAGLYQLPESPELAAELEGQLRINFTTGTAPKRFDLD